MSKCLACNREDANVIGLLISTEAHYYSNFTLCTSCYYSYSWAKKNGDYVYLVCKVKE